MNTSKWISLLLSALLSSTVLARPRLEHGVGNGGDDAVISIRAESEFLGKRLAALTSACRAKIPITGQELIDTYVHADIQVTDDPQLLGGIEKEAINYPDIQQIIFSRDAVTRFGRPQSTLIVHEGLGLLRVDDGYFVSQYIVDLTSNPACFNADVDFPPATPLKSNIPPNGFTPSAIQVDEAGHIYFLDADQLAIYRYDLSSKSYLAGLSLHQGPGWISYSPALSRLYIAYQDGTISAVGTEAFNKEVPFAFFGSGVSAMAAAGRYLFVAPPRDEATRTGNVLYDEFGTVRSEDPFSQYSTVVVWSTQLHSILSIVADASPHWLVQTPIVGGRLGSWTLPTSRDVLDYAPPIFVGESRVVTGSGQILSGATLAPIGQLPIAVEGAVWIGDQLITASEKAGDGRGGLELKSWRPPFKSAVDMPVESGAIFTALVKSGTHPVLIYQLNGDLHFQELR